MISQHGEGDQEGRSVASIREGGRFLTCEAQPLRQFVGNFQGDHGDLQVLPPAIADREYRTPPCHRQVASGRPHRHRRTGCPGRRVRGRGRWPPGARPPGRENVVVEDLPRLEPSLPVDAPTILRAMRLGANSLPRSLVILALLVVSLAWQGSRRIATGKSCRGRIASETDVTLARGPTAGGDLQHSQRQGLMAGRELPRTAACLRGIDVVGLNEVRGGALGALRTRRRRSGETLGRGWLFAPAERRWWRMTSATDC